MNYIEEIKSMMAKRQAQLDTIDRLLVDGTDEIDKEYLLIAKNSVAASISDLVIIPAIAGLSDEIDDRLDKLLENEALSIEMMDKALCDL